MEPVRTSSLGFMRSFGSSRRGETLQLRDRSDQDCGGTSSASWRSEIRTMRSTGANTRMIPGPLGLGSSRPRRKITPRSYSRRILIELRMYRTTIIMAMKGIGIIGRLLGTELKCVQSLVLLGYSVCRISIRAHEGLLMAVSHLSF